MTQEALKQMYQLLLTEPHAPTVCAQLERIAREALAEHAMKETQRLGQEIEQEPVAWLLTDKKINSLQVDDIQRLIDRLKHAHHTDLCVRINGQDEWFEADWLKHMVRASPPQPEQEPVAWVSEDVCKGQYIDGRPRKIWWECKKGVGTAFYTTPPQRTWVGLTDEEILDCNLDEEGWMIDREVAKRNVEAKLKEKNT